MADRQHGMVATRHLEALGWGRPAISRHAADGRLTEQFRGVYAWGHGRVTIEGRWMAAVLACGEGAVLSHLDALVIRGLVRSAASRIHVTVPRLTGGAHRRSGIVTHRCRLDPQDVTMVDGIPVTTLARAFLDFAEIARFPRQVDRALEAAEKQGVLDLDAIADVVGRHPGRRGAKPLRRALAIYVPEPHHDNSWLERRALRLIREAGLPMPQVNLDLNGNQVDLQWPEHGLVVELDSRAHHHTTFAFEEDRVRDAVQVARGHGVMRFTYRRITQRPDEVVALLRERLSRGTRAA